MTRTRSTKAALALLVLVITVAHGAESGSGPAGAESDSGPETDTRPNILVIIADDLGYTDIGPYGAEIKTPTLDRLAAEGVRFSNFHVLASCAPTRAVFLSGTDNHTAGLGSQLPTPEQQQHPGYEGHLNQRVAILPEILRTAGYRTYHAGKWHMGMEDDQSPHARGFQETFGLVNGGGSHYADSMWLSPEEPMLYRRNGEVVDQLDPDFYSSRSFTDALLDWLERDQHSNKPFFAHLAFTAPHDPLQAPRSVIDEYEGFYNMGYEELRKTRLDNLKEQGLIPADWTLPPWPAMVKSWNDLTNDERAIRARDMEIYAAMIDYMDRQIGRVYRWLEQNGQLDNTAIVFFSDNGANGFSTGAYPGQTDEYLASFDNSLENRGGPGSFVVTGAGWATASTAAFRMFKAFLTEGGIRTPAIVRLPGSPASNRINHGFVHVSDLMPTFLEWAGATHPSESDPETPGMIGQSITPLLRGDQAGSPARKAVGYEMHGAAALVKEGWKLLRMPPPLSHGDWELYDLNSDPHESDNLALSNRAKFREMLSDYRAYEKSAGVVAGVPQVLQLFSTFYQGVMFLIAGLAGGIAVFIFRANVGKTEKLVASVAGLAGAVALFTPASVLGAWLLLTVAAYRIIVVFARRAGLRHLVLPAACMLGVALYLYIRTGSLVAFMLG